MAELIVAFDLPSGREALDLAARLPDLRWVKIGPILHVREGPALVLGQDALISNAVITGRSVSPAITRA